MYRNLRLEPLEERQLLTVIVEGNELVDDPGAVLEETIGSVDNECASDHQIAVSGTRESSARSTPSSVPKLLTPTLVSER
ncbi:MAG: hypothetical protein ACOX1P_05200 [Thermoguttaceae bacterium]